MATSATEKSLDKARGYRCRTSNYSDNAIWIRRCHVFEGSKPGDEIVKVVEDPERLTVAEVAASIFRGPATEEIERALRPNEDFGLVIELGHALNAPLFVFSPISCSSRRRTACQASQGRLT